MGNSLEQKIDGNKNSILEEKELVSFISNEKNLKELGSHLSQRFLSFSDTLLRVTQELLTKQTLQIAQKVKANKPLSSQEQSVVKLDYIIRNKSYPTIDMSFYVGSMYGNTMYGKQIPSLEPKSILLQSKKEITPSDLPILNYEKGYETASVKRLDKWFQSYDYTAYMKARMDAMMRVSQKPEAYRDDYLKYEMANIALEHYAKIITTQDKKFQTQAGYKNTEDYNRQMKIISELSTALSQYEKEKFPTISTTIKKFESYTNDINITAKKYGYTSPEKQNKSAESYKQYSGEVAVLSQKFKIEELKKTLANPSLKSGADLENYFKNANLMSEYAQQCNQLKQKHDPKALQQYEKYMKSVGDITTKYGPKNISDWGNQIERYMQGINSFKKGYAGHDVDFKVYEKYQSLVAKNGFARQKAGVSNLSLLLSDPTQPNSPFHGLTIEAEEKKRHQSVIDQRRRSIKDFSPTIYQTLNFASGAWNGLVDFTVGTGSSLGLMIMKLYKDDNEWKASTDFKGKFDNFLKFGQSTAQNKPPIDEQGNRNLGADNTVNQVGSQLANMLSLLSGAGAIGRGVTKLGVGAMISQKVGLVSMAFITQVGRSFEEAKLQGLDDSQALSYTLLQSSIGSGLELISPNDMIMGSGKKVVKEYIKNILKTETKQSLLQVSKLFVKNLGGEIVEENMQEAMQLAVGNGINMRANDKRNAKFDATMTLDNFATTALLTTLTTGVASAKGSAKSTISSHTSDAQLKLKQEIASHPLLYGQVTEMLQKMISNKSLSQGMSIDALKQLDGELRALKGGKKVASDGVEGQTGQGSAEVSNKNQLNISQDIQTANSLNSDKLINPDGTQDIQPLLTRHPDLLKNIINPEALQAIIQSEIASGNLILNTDGSIKEVYTEVGGEKKPSQLFAKMKADGFSEQQALKTWLQVRTPEFKNRFGDRQSTDKSQVSKVVDENGEPLMVYHRTSSLLDTFDKSLGGQNKRIQTVTQDGFYFCADKNKWSVYGEKIIPVFLKSNNIGRINDHGSREAGTLARMNGEIIKELGYDGIYGSFRHEINNDNILLDAEGKETIVVDKDIYGDNIYTYKVNLENAGVIAIFDPKNIKGAIYNDGSFSPETAKFNDYFGKESRFGFDSKQARENSTFMDKISVWFKKGPNNLAEGLDDVRNKIQKLYTDKTGKKLELTDAQIQAIIDTHLLPGQLGQLTQTELIAKNRKLAEAIPDADVRRFLLEAGFCGMLEDVKPYDLLGISPEKYKEIILEGGGFAEIDKLFEEKFGMKKNIYYFIKKHPEFSEGELRNYINDLKSYELDPLSLSLSYYNNPNEIKKFLMASNMGTSTMNELFEGGIDFLEIKKLHSLGILEGFNIHDKIIKIKADKHLEDLINNYHKFSKIKELSSIKENYLGDKILLIYESGYTFDRFQSLLGEITKLGLDNTQREKIIKIGIDNYRHLQNSGYDVHEINSIIENKFLLDYCVKNNTKLDVMNIYKFMYNFSGDQYTDIPKISQFVNNANVSYSLDWMAKIIKENNIDMFVTYKSFNEAKADILQKYIIPMIDRNQIVKSDLSISQKKEYVKSKNEFSKDYSLTDIEYKNLFLYDGINKKSELSQGYIGNCRLIAFMNDLRVRNFFESIVRSSIKKVENGYEVTMPLGAKDGKKITVYEDDIVNFSTDEQGETMYRSNTYRSTHKLDGIYSQEFAQQYKKGFTLLEIAFAKYISKSDVADAKVINGSQGTLDEIYNQEDLIDNRFILFKKGIDFSNMKYESIQSMYNALMKFKQGNYIISPHIAYTIEDQKLENSKKSEYLPSGHAYSVSDVSIDAKGDMIITVTNPWDTKSLNTKFTLQEFLTFFSSISVSEINLDQLFYK